MSERAELLHNLRQLVELDRGFGIEFSPAPSAAPATATPAARTAPAGPASATATPARPATATFTRPAAAPRPVPAPAATALPAAADELWSPPGDLVTLPPAEGVARIAAAIAGCQRCGLCAQRTNVVPGEGNPQPELLFIGEGPGADEDRLGRPFVGAAGQLLDKMIVAMGFQRSEVFIANVVKCRPPGNRTPEPDEVRQCMPYLRAQIAVLKPKVICTLGNVPLKALFGDAVAGITRARGQKMLWQGITVIPTFHPSYLLRNEAAKKPCWEDLKTVVAELGRELPRRG